MTKRSLGGSAVDDVSLSDPLPFDPKDDSPEPQHPAYVWVRYTADTAPHDGLDYVAAIEGAAVTQSVPAVGAANDTLARIERQVSEIATRLVTNGYPQVEGRSTSQPTAATEAADDMTPESRPPFPVLINVEDAAALLGISKTALYSRIERGQVRGVVKSGRRIQFHREVLLAKLAKGAK